MSEPKPPPPPTVDFKKTPEREITLILIVVNHWPISSLPTNASSERLNAKLRCMCAMTFKREDKPPTACNDCAIPKQPTRSVSNKYPSVLGNLWPTPANQYRSFNHSRKLFLADRLHQPCSIPTISVASLTPTAS